MINKDVVITVGTAIGSALALALAIRKKVDCKVFVLCADKKTAECLKKSKFINEVFLMNSKTEKEYVTKIKEWYSTKAFTEKPILYFTTDTACFYIDNYRNWFEENFTLCLPSSSIIQAFTQKGLAEVEAKKAGLQVPKTQVLKNKNDLEQINNTFSFPVIIKPLATYLKQGIDFKIKVLNNKEAFNSFTKELIENNISVLCQEFIPGGDEASYYYLFYRSKEGVVYGNMGQKTLQSSSKGGVMVKGLTKYNENLAKISKEFLQIINYNGIGGIEFKKHQSKYYFIEMSVRLEGFYKIAEISNSPLSLFSYYDLTDNKKELKTLYEKNPKQKDGYIYMDFFLTWVTQIKEKMFISLFKDFFSITFNRNLKLNVYAQNDTKPFWKSIKNIIIR